ncbi:MULTISPECIES: hypothetical protein [Micrococcaceae]|uniref:hypothetical protein n=1 Tax=Micrococcaceae TaxID=1268 RepID=UPI00027DF267|nr:MULTISPECIES: hypothetical protein [Micrococcaceae]AFR31158.1 hypothetical protein ARUE_c42860 [Arthrobacter sp. Rue61a]MBP2268277.1 hypothetical protein [Pseudarthrobacter sp. PvP004]
MSEKHPTVDAYISAQPEPTQQVLQEGTLKFPLAKPIPYSLMGKVAAQLAAEKKMRH